MELDGGAVGGGLVVPNGQLNLDLYDRARRQLDEALNIHETINIRDALEGLRYYARSARDRELESKAVELRMRAERKAGRFLIQMKAEGRRASSGGDRKSSLPVGNDDLVATLRTLGISPKQSMLWQRIARVQEDIFEATIHRLYDSAKAAMFTSKSDEWMTPPEVLERVRVMFGTIDIDPCAEGKRGDTHNVPATSHITKAEDGLAHVWRGTVFMNPPYSEAEEWCEKLIRDWRDQLVTHAIALLAARTDTVWFRMFKCAPVCFVSGRLRFGTPAGSETIGDSAPFPSALFYLGPDSHKKKFISAFATLGQIRDAALAG